MIALACDHTGIELKREIMKMLDEMGLEWKDFGTNEPVSCDYPVYGYRAARAVADGECDRGILICGTGIGIGIAASKVRGTRVCTCSDVYSAELSKRHNNSNILTMGARVVGVDLAKMIAVHWLTAIALGFCLAGGYFFISKSMRNVSPVSAALLSNLEPILNPVWAFLLVGERPGRLTVVGAAIVLAAATVYALLPARNGE